MIQVIITRKKIGHYSVHKFKFKTYDQVIPQIIKFIESSKSYDQGSITINNI